MEAVSGNLQLTDVSSDGELSAETVTGRVAIETVRAPRLEVSSVSGGVALDGVQSRRVEVETVVGPVTFAGALVADGRYEFQSHSGSIRLEVPASSGFELEAESFSGDLCSEIPISVGRGDRAQEVTGFEGGDREVDGVAGAGGGRVELSTFSGDMTIETDPAR